MIAAHYRLQICFCPQNAHGHTALHVACQNGHCQVCAGHVGGGGGGGGVVVVTGSERQDEQSKRQPLRTFL